MKTLTAEKDELLDSVLFRGTKSTHGIEQLMMSDESLLAGLHLAAGTPVDLPDEPVAKINTNIIQLWD